MAEEEYDLVPHSEVEKLKKQFQDLKEHPYGETESGRKLMSGIDELSRSIEGLMDLLKDAAEQMSERPEEGSQKEVMDKLDELIDENKKIAKGVLAVADMIKDLQNSMQQPVQRQMPQQQMTRTFEPNLGMPPSPFGQPQRQPMQQMQMPPLTGAPINQPGMMNMPPQRAGPMPMGGMPPPPPMPPAGRKKGMFG